MYYIWHANELHASPDGRLSGQPFSANYAPSLNVRVNGPLSVVQSFTTPNLGRVINGGPLTIEWRESDGHVLMTGGFKQAQAPLSFCNFLQQGRRVLGLEPLGLIQAGCAR